MSRALYAVPAHLGKDFRFELDEFAHTLKASGLADRTIRTYADAGAKLATWLQAHEMTTFGDVDKRAFRRYMVWFLGPARFCRPCMMRAAGRGECNPSLWMMTAECCPLCQQPTKPFDKGYANNQFRALRQLFKWYAAEEDTANPMDGLTAPKPDERMVPVLTTDQLSALISDADSGRDYTGRRDAAILRLFASTGIRLNELATIEIDGLDIEKRTAVVLGKAGRWRAVRFDHGTARALRRYLRLRDEHPHAVKTPRLWIAERRRVPMTPSGIYQMIERRADRLGIYVHPHMFRHTFSHRWLAAGGAEGDLMELNGWRSPQMLRRYGASEKAARAHSHYDNVNPMEGIR